jgi:hypothetical protein
VFRAEGFKFGKGLDTVLETLRLRHAISNDFNVIKFRTDELKVSFLAYPDFFNDAHLTLWHVTPRDVWGKSRKLEAESGHGLTSAAARSSGTTSRRCMGGQGGV